MELPLKFPDHSRGGPEAGRGVPAPVPDELWREIAALTAFGLALIRSSPHREAIERVHAERRREWQAIQRELFRRHGSSVGQD